MNNKADFSFLVYYLYIPKYNLIDHRNLIMQECMAFKTMNNITVPVIPTFGGTMEGYHRVEHYVEINLKNAF